MRKALIVGIDDYDESPLSGCITDASKMAKVLSKNQDNSPNFDCKILTSDKENITRDVLKENIVELFNNKAEITLFYFSGHGTAPYNLGGYLVTQDVVQFDEGVSMSDCLNLANKSNSRQIVIILDCCYSGNFGNTPTMQNDTAILREGISILTACRSTQVAMENNNSGVFTSLLYDAFNGGSTDILGNVTVANLYAYVDRMLGAWQQRPLYKASVSKFLVLRKCNPEVELKILRLLPEYFKTAKSRLKLDKSFEPNIKPRNKKNELIFSHLHYLRNARLVVPVGDRYLYRAAMNSKSCKLTAQGRYFWKLVKLGRI